MRTLGYIIQEGNVEIIEPIMNSYRLYTSLYDALEAAQEKCDAFTENRDEDVEGPYEYFTVSTAILEASGCVLYFKSRDHRIWISCIYQN